MAKQRPIKLTLNVVAQTIQLFYYKGRVKADTDLHEKIFMQYAKQAYGKVIRDIFWELKKNGEREEYDYIADVLSTVEVKVLEADKYGRRFIDISDISFIHLPDNNHIFEITPLSESECDCGNIVPVTTGSSRFYKDLEFSNFPFYEVVGTEKLKVYHVPDCITDAELTGFIEKGYDDGNIPIPYDIAFDVCNMVLGTVLKIKGFPVDRNDADMPNAKELNNQLLAN